jgi:hypothetical protein
VQHQLGLISTEEPRGSQPEKPLFNRWLKIGLVFPQPNFGGRPLIGSLIPGLDGDDGLAERTGGRDAEQNGKPAR